MACGQVGGWLDPLKIRINSASVEVEAELGNSNYEIKKYLTVYQLQSRSVHKTAKLSSSMDTFN